MNKRNVAVIVALIVVVGAIMMNSSVGQKAGSPGNTSLLSGFSNIFSGGTPSINDTFNTTFAWAVFQDYLKFAKAHDIEGIKSLSYKLSETCSNPAGVEECKVLMDSVHEIARGFKFEDFKNIAHDDKQIIMSTDYLKLFEEADPAKTVLYFIKSENGEPKVLGIRFCYGAETDDYQCVNTDPASRDADKDGWWDDIEVLFR